MSSFQDNMVNPVIKKVLNDTERTEETVVTYKGVLRKSGLYLLAFIIGAITAMVVHTLVPVTAYDSGSDVLVCNKAEIIVMGILGFVGLITSIVASFSYRLAGVFGAIACVSFGYPLGFLASAIPAYQGAIFLALLLTVVLVGVLLFLYRTRIIKVTQKFKTFIWATVLTVLIGSLFMVILHFIPATAYIVEYVYANPVLSIVLGIFGVMLGCFFLLWDFDSVENAVTNGVDKKYENIISFSLAFSVIYLYFKVLQLILRIMQNSRN